MAERKPRSQRCHGPADAGQSRYPYALALPGVAHADPGACATVAGTTTRTWATAGQADTVVIPDNAIDTDVTAIGGSGAVLQLAPRGSQRGVRHPGEGWG